MKKLNFGMSTLNSRLLNSQAIHSKDIIYLPPNE